MLEPLFTASRRAEILAVSDASGHARNSSQWWDFLWDVLTEVEQEAVWEAYKMGGHHMHALLREQLEVER